MPMASLEATARNAVRVAALGALAAPAGVTGIAFLIGHRLNVSIDIW